MSTFVHGRNYTGEFQELLQAKAPNLGSRCHELWGFGDSGNTAPFSAWVNLMCEHGNLELPISEAFPNKKLAKQHASWRAIEWVRDHAKELIFEDGSFILRSPRRNRGHNGSSVTTYSPPHSCSRGSGGGGGGGGGGNSTTSGSQGSNLTTHSPPHGSSRGSGGGDGGKGGSGNSTTSPVPEPPSLDILIRSNGVIPYPYQLQVVNAATRENTIANIPTGKGTIT
jgi:hypothetical protein